MNRLLKIANDENIDVNLFSMKSLTALSIPKAIALNPDKIENRAQLRVVTAHELGHHKRNSFYNINSPLETKRRREERATRWAVDTLLPAVEIKKAFKKGYTEVWQLAEYFDVTEDFVKDAIRVHRLKGRL